jgi:hypothetical protein
MTITKKKSYKELADELEQIELNEFRVIRAGAAILYANKVKTDGARIESQMNNAKTYFDRAKREDEVGDKLDFMISGMSKLADGLISTRRLLGNQTGINVITALISERSTKELQKLMKGKRKR